jgi:hypothetical protein
VLLPPCVARWRQALAYVERAKALPGSWQFCLEYFLQGQDRCGRVVAIGWGGCVWADVGRACSSVETRFFALQVVEEALRDRYDAARDAFPPALAPTLKTSGWVGERGM